jgi:hypothetical protein
LQSCYKNDTKTEEKQKDAEQAKKEEERASKKVHEKQEIAQEPCTDYAQVSNYTLSIPLFSSD